jgi:hypothetical protein
MFTIKNWVQLTLILAAFVVFIPRGAAQTFSCSSDDGKRHYCPAQGPAQLVKQRSDSPCRQGYSWGTDNRGVWVDHGCRADFAVVRAGYNGNHYGGKGQVVSCSSDDMHRHYCPANTRGGVRLLKKNSDSSCNRGSDWGYDKRGIWVDHGCRADFQVGY